MGERKRKAAFSEKIGLPAGYNLQDGMSILNDAGNEPVALTYLIYAHNQGVTLRDFAAAMLTYAEKEAKISVDERNAVKDFSAEERKSATDEYDRIKKVKDESDGGLTLNPDYAGLIDLLEEWGEYEEILENHSMYASVLLAYHRAGESILGIINQICITDGNPNDPEVLDGVARYTNRPQGSKDALIHFSDDGDEIDEDDEDY